LLHASLNPRLSCRLKIRKDKALAALPLLNHNLHYKTSKYKSKNIIHPRGLRFYDEQQQIGHAQRDFVLLCCTGIPYRCPFYFKFIVNDFMKQERKKPAAKSTIKKKTLLDMHAFTTDLVNVKEYAERKGVSHTAVIYFLDNGGIPAEDIYLICGRRYWSWDKYKKIIFRNYKH
jgi:hypothetical protein